MNRGKGQRSFKPKDFIVDFEPRKAKPKQSVLQMAAFAKAFATRHNEVVKEGES